ncbi:hypothetical protein HNR02_000908 [Amycolatopsis endophytica]|uniref:Uncharacterized protein n=1 Tax=Amycolatopsis endophytica TaxID=860233 RepID=A0A853AY82_9PSEU|nr:DUF2000 family protein [Amycolatopsis endophytica]NYI87585.1 hypothetical protein [Amycolatopsis endophytica]
MHRLRRAVGRTPVAGPDGQDYEDASGRAYLPMFGQPVLVYTADGAELSAARDKALEGLALHL